MKKNTTRLNIEKDLAKLMGEIKKHGFKSKDELNDLVHNTMNQNLNDDIPEKLDPKDYSQDLVFEAYEETATKGKALVKKALELDPNNADAYSYLASIHKDIDQAIVLYKKAIKAGLDTLGKDFLKENKGHFWMILETRPYMRAKVGLADCFYAKKEVDKAIAIYEELLELNPNDNQGIRYLLSTLLLSKTDLSGFENFIQKMEEENCAVWNYNNALYAFKKSGPTAKSKKMLLQAYNNNPFVIDYLLGNKKMPKQQPQYIGIGDENEAIAYVNGAWTVWKKAADAFEWLYQFSQKK